MPDLGLPHLYAGKVRDLFALSDDPRSGPLLMVTSDRLSARDQILDVVVPDKGRVLTALSAFWFGRLGEVLPGHLLSTDVDDLPTPQRRLADRYDLHGRVAVVQRANMLPVECIVRSYLTGSAWVEYCQHRTVGGVHLPRGLRHGDRLPQPMFTPSTKAALGQRDVTLPRPELVGILGASLADEVEEVALVLYERGAAWAQAQGIVLADSKFELGFVGETLMLCDEVLTPDTSRFWAAPGRTDGPPTFDRQVVRDHLDHVGWDGQPPPPRLPPEVVDDTRRRYIQAYEVLSGTSFAAWPGVGADVAATACDPFLAATAVTREFPSGELMGPVEAPASGPVDRLAGVT